MNLPLLLLLLFSYLPIQGHDLHELRVLLREGSEKKQSAEQLFQKVGEYNGEDALLLAYKASAYGLRAKYSGNPIKKLKSIKTSSRIFSQAISRNGVHLEIRFLRYAVEYRTPRSLDLSDHLNEDKTMLINGLKAYPNSSFDEETVRIVRDFLQQNCHCSEEEQEVLRNVKF